MRRTESSWVLVGLKTVGLAVGLQPDEGSGGREWGCFLRGQLGGLVSLSSRPRVSLQSVAPGLVAGERGGERGVWRTRAFGRQRGAAPDDVEPDPRQMSHSGRRGACFQDDGNCGKTDHPLVPLPARASLVLLLLKTAGFQVTDLV